MSIETLNERIFRVQICLDEALANHEMTLVAALRRQLRSLLSERSTVENHATA